MRLEYQYHYQNSFSFRRRDNLDYRNHAQGEVELVVMLRGTCNVKCGSYETVLRAGDVFMAFPNQPHRYEGSRDVDVYVLIVPVKQYLSAYYNTLLKLVPVCPVLHEGEYDPAVLRMVENAYSDLKTVTEPVVQGYLMVIFGKVLSALQFQQRQSGADEALRRVLGFLNEHYRENLTRTDIAKAAGYNESYISHLFSQTMGVTLPEYIHAMRIDDACHLLKETDLTVAQIASELGFASIRNFNRVFLSRTGVTPRQYRITDNNDTVLL